MDKNPQPQTPVANGLARRLTGLSKIILGGSVFIITALIFLNVVLRYWFNSGVFFTEELSELLFVWMVFLGALIVLKEGTHIGVDLVISRLNPPARRIASLLSNLLMLGITLLMLKGGIVQLKINWDVKTPATGFPMSAYVLSIVFFSACASLILLNNIIRWRSATHHDAGVSSDTAI
ncbi:MAG: TRAP transporter small permease [Castellaniella sp.]|uniref:TRAP transporter small permease n=1 Tax=Castellaniella sp. TaxID=1955812 RepID=UPI003C715A7E